MPILLCGVSHGGNFVIDNNGSFYVFRQGSYTNVDISWAVMNRNIDFVRNRLASTFLSVEELSHNGIVVKTEMEDIETALGYLDLARFALSKHSFSNCYINLRAAYVMEQDVRSRVASLLADATFSSIPLSFMLVLSGFGLAYIFVEKETSRIGAGVSASLFLIGFYYYVSPGMRLTDPILLAISNAMAAALAIGFVLLLPRIGKDIVTQSGIALASSIMSTFSLATRNLKRRKMRSSLILASILTFVFGFTVFTSFRVKADVAFGRPTSSYPSKHLPIGLMVLPPPGRPTPNPLSIPLVEAMMTNPLIASVAPKTETSPYYLEAQLISEEGQKIPIRGAIGVSSDEAKINDLDAAIVEGHYFSKEEHAILVSKRAAQKLGIKPGDKVKFSWGSSTGTFAAEYMVAGILDDQILEGIIDLKLGEPTRIRIQTKSADDVVPLAKDLARKWRYLVFASTGDGVKPFYYRKDPMLLGGTTIPMVLVLVGLNVLACTLNAVYERRK
ncbi:MAG: ABC transporter permease, partial [Thermoproteota archaeon]